MRTIEYSFMYEQLPIDYCNNFYDGEIREYNNVVKCDIINGFYTMVKTQDNFTLLHDNIRFNEKMYIDNTMNLYNAGSHCFCCVKDNIMYTGHYEPYDGSDIKKIRCGYEIVNLFDKQIKQFYCMETYVFYINVNNEMYIKYITHDTVIHMGTIKGDYIIQSIGNYILLINKYDVFYINIHGPTVNVINYPFNISFTHAVKLNNFIWNKKNNKFLDEINGRLVREVIMCNRYTKYKKIPYFVLCIVINYIIN